MQGQVALQVRQHRIRRVEEHQVVSATGRRIGRRPGGGHRRGDSRRSVAVPEPLDVLRNGRAAPPATCRRTRHGGAPGERLQTQRAAAGEQIQHRLAATRRASIEKSASRTRSVVGRVPPPRGSRQPHALPLAGNDPHREGSCLSRPVEILAERSRRVSASSSCSVAESLPSSSMAMASRRAPAASRRWRAQPGVAQVGDAALARRQHGALAAQLEVDLGQLKAVGGAHHRLQPCAGIVGGGIGHQDAEALVRAPRPTRPRSWCSWASPNRSAPSITITRGVGHVHTHLDHRGRHQHVDLAPAELLHQSPAARPIGSWPCMHPTR